MTAPTSVALTDIVVSLCGPWAPGSSLRTEHPGADAHINIDLDAAAADAFGTLAAATASTGAAADELRAAATYVAGFLARVAVQAVDWLEVERRSHGCRRLLLVDDASSALDRPQPDDDLCCQIDSALFDLRRWDWVPSLTLTVPYLRRDVWLDRVEQWLTNIAEETA